MIKPPPYLHILGIRHHGPGSARALLQALNTLQPDCILVEGPSDGNELIPWLGHPDMQPPIALLIYRPDHPNKGTFYPYAEFSPEFQAIRYGLGHNCTVRFMDLPQANMLAAEGRPKMPGMDLFKEMAAAAGYDNYDHWWHILVEQRRENTAVFAGILELMHHMRQNSSISPAQPDQLAEAVSQKLADQREAYMRSSIRQARAEGHEHIAVVCGAWHGPALTDVSDEASDAALLLDMPSVDVEAAWVPWTYGRLSFTTGYGAGIYSPGWYHHLWECTAEGLESFEVSARWLTKVAALLRAEGLDASPAHAIEAVRLAEALAGMRHLPFPSLEELDEATLTILCEGNEMPMALIREKLTISDRMGVIPPNTPMVPLQRDLYMLQQKLRLSPEPQPEKVMLDLRQSLDLSRSHLLHRLNLLKIAWGKQMAIRNKQVGTYQEHWRLVWKPNLSMQVIEAAMWGNTVKSAAENFAQDQADTAKDLAALTQLLDQIILADLPDTILYLMNRIEELSAISSDVPLMMEALLPLVRVLRYGSVRQLDEDVIQHVVDGLITRICIGLPSTCQSLDDDAALKMAEQITAVQTTISTLKNESHQENWAQTLLKIVDQNRVPGLVAGKVCRLLIDGRIFTVEDAQVRMEQVLSLQTAARASQEQLAESAAWVDGFLQGSGLLILHDQLLWTLLDNFVSGLDDDRFQTVLPLFRRTFSSFSEAAREQLIRRVQHGQQIPVEGGETAVGFDQEQANAILPTLSKLLGITEQGNQDKV